MRDRAKGFWARLADDADGVIARDPAARSRLEVMLCYAGFHALLFYRLANALWRREWRLLGRLASQLGRFLTGIEIHPGATIGRRLFIDHGMGVVIGETAEIGDDVTLYHDVTLGGVAPSVDSARQRQQKRHPTLGDNVIVGSGAQILGPIVVGEGARVGANAVVLADVAAHATVVGIPARPVASRKAADAADDDRFMAYGLPCDGTVPDPVARAMQQLADEVGKLRARVAELEGRGAANASGGEPHERAKSMLST
ncbi:MAG: serine O-acetyltransferase [Alphaproteobacteria bacterium]|nr:serine O-acetyltransferase [Alphaproteobacteria bacterium]